MSAVLIKAVNDLRRRRLQAAVVFVAAFLGIATGTMAATLLSQAGDPYLSAFEAQKGAHLQVQFDRRLDAGTIAATPALIRASASGGPYAATPLQIEFRSHKLSLATVGRDNPGGQVEQLHITAGHWPAQDSEIALTHSFADLNRISIGDRLRVISVPGEPVLVVVGEVVDIDEASADISSQNSWVLSTAVGSLTPKDSSYYVMDYRFATAPSNSGLQSAVSALRTYLPPGSITRSINYLSIRDLFNLTSQIVTGLLLGLSVFALLATVAIVANLVTGIVISAYREIGIMKAIGFTPFQVEAVFVLQIVIPVALAAILAIPLGTLASQPILANSWQALGLAYQPTYSLAVDALALVGSLVIASVAAIVPAFRAGRLRPAAVIGGASAPHGRSGRSLRRLAARLRLPRPVVLGVGDAFARPRRAILTLITIFLGVTTVTLALGIPRSFATIVTASDTGRGADVVVRRSPALTDAAAMHIITADRRAARVVAEHDENVTVPGIGDPVTARMFRGDPSAIGFLLVSGRWFRGAGEAVAPRALLQDAHLKIGDHVTVTVANTSVSIVLVGDALDATNGGLSLLMDVSTVRLLEPDAAPETYLVALTPGSDVDAYVHRVALAQPDLLDVQRADVNSIGVIQTIGGVLFVLAAVMIVIAIAGIFNTLLLNMRERIRDTATLKALGMSPRQVMVMVAASAAPLALLGGVIAVPAGIGLDRAFITILGTVAGGNDIPPAVYEVFAAWELVLIPLVGVAVAVAAALIPGRRAARRPVIDVLHAE